MNLRSAAVMNELKTVGSVIFMGVVDKNTEFVSNFNATLSLFCSASPLGKTDVCKIATNSVFVSKS